MDLGEDCYGEQNYIYIIGNLFNLSSVRHWSSLHLQQEQQQQQQHWSNERICYQMISLDFFTSPSAPLPTPLPAPLVTPFNVLLALALLLLDIILSALLHLEISKTLLISAGRCIIQLSLMGFVLDAVFKYLHVLSLAHSEETLTVLLSGQVGFSLGSSCNVLGYASPRRQRSHVREKQSKTERTGECKKLNVYFLQG